MKKMFKKITAMTMVLTMLFTLSVSALAADNVHVKNYTPEEIATIAQTYVDNKSNNVLLHSNSKNIGVGYTVIREYRPSVTNKKLDAFPIQEFTYDRTGQPTSEVQVSYTNNTSVSWAVSGGIDSTVSVFNLIKGKVNFNVARTSVVGASAHSSVPYTLAGNKKYSITIYAHGVDTSGVFVREYYDYDDVLVQTENVPASALLPFTSYTQTNGIHFGPAIVIG